MFNDETWMILMLLLYSAYEHGIDVNSMVEQEKADAEFVKNCPSVEWEQDMHADVPFCTLDGEMCNMQCKNRNFGNFYNAEKSDIYKKEQINGREESTYQQDRYTA